MPKIWVSRWCKRLFLALRFGLGDQMGDLGIRAYRLNHDDVPRIEIGFCWPVPFLAALDENVFGLLRLRVRGANHVVNLRHLWIISPKAGKLAVEYLAVIEQHSLIRRRKFRKIFGAFQGHYFDGQHHDRDGQADDDNRCGFAQEPTSWDFRCDSKSRKRLTLLGSKLKHKVAPALLGFSHFEKPKATKNPCICRILRQQGFFTVAQNDTQRASV